MSSSPTPPQSKIITPQTAHDLAYGNLLKVFSERDASKRQAAIKDVYNADCVVYEPGSITFSGAAATDETVQKLLTEREGWDFVPVGNVQLNHDFVYLKWGFGPRSSGEFGSGDPEGVDVKATGADHFLVDPESKKIKLLYVVIDGAADVRL